MKAECFRSFRPSAAGLLTWSVAKWNGSSPPAATDTVHVRHTPFLAAPAGTESWTWRWTWNTPAAYRNLYTLLDVAEASSAVPQQMDMVWSTGKWHRLIGDAL